MNNNQRLPAKWETQILSAQRVAAARDHLLRCGSSEMSRIDCVATPRIWPRGARNATYASSATGC